MSYTTSWGIFQTWKTILVFHHVKPFLLFPLSYLVLWPHREPQQVPKPSLNHSSSIFCVIDTCSLFYWGMHLYLPIHNPSMFILQGRIQMLLPLRNIPELFSLPIQMLYFHRVIASYMDLGEAISFSNGLLKRIFSSGKMILWTMITTIISLQQQ